jgi:hypothetical protein
MSFNIPAARVSIRSNPGTSRFQYRSQRGALAASYKYFAGNALSRQFVTFWGRQYWPGAQQRMVARSRSDRCLTPDWGGVRWAFLCVVALLIVAIAKPPRLVHRLLSVLARSETVAPPIRSF